MIAVGVNCTAPRFVGSLITAAREATSKPLVAYPNSGEMYDAEAKGWLQGESEPRSAGTAAQWAENGARIIGGCCRTGPAEIRSLRAQLLG